MVYTCRIKPVKLFEIIGVLLFLSLFTVMKLDIKTALAVITLLFAIAGSYFTVTNDIHNLSLKVKGLSTENHDIRKRLGATDKKILKMRKQLRELNK